MTQRALAMGATVLLALPSLASDLSLADRVKAQELIERVYYAHQLDVVRPFDVVYPRATIEGKVRRYLAQSVELDRRWKNPITAEMLDRELARMARSTQAPERLLELFAALDGDPVLVKECLVRPVLADRLARSFGSSDGARALNVTDVPTVASSSPLPRIDASGDFACGADDTWDAGWLNGLVRARSEHSAIWTGSAMVVWGGWDGTNRLDTGGRYDPATDTWTPTSTVGAPSPRSGHSAVWTGTTMVVWGGQGTSAYLNDGGRYDPVADTWTSMSIVGAPAVRRDAAVVWTGTRMIVWGGQTTISDLKGTGGRYDPAGDTWTPVTTIGAPTPRRDHTAVWTGTVMVVWGGYDGGGGVMCMGKSATGGRYDPSSDSWTPTAAGPTCNLDHVAVWTGTEMIVEGGVTGTLSRYNPVSNTWTSGASGGAPVGHSAVWTGTRMVVWGGLIGTSSYEDHAKEYDPVSNTWETAANFGAPFGRRDQTAIWTGSRMIVWGGLSSGAYLSTGGRYDPANNSWVATSTSGRPADALWRHTAVWTGNLLIIWGGNRARSFEDFNTGWRYDPAIDVWSPTSTVGAPSTRASHGAAWTGDRMVVWGGIRWDGASYVYLDTGGRYDPVNDTWSPTTTTNAPMARENPMTIGGAGRMMVWSGNNLGNAPVVGGRYDPVADVWQTMTTTNAPAVRQASTAVWTGSRMLIWGGHQGTSGGTLLNDGALYDPVADQWTSISSVGAPSARGGHTAVWTGSRMVVWGGEQGARVDTGGVYDLATDSWTPTSTAGAPAARDEHTAVWTGSRMVVWGGLGFPSFVDLNTGGRYDPVTDTWAATSLTIAAFARRNHTATWTGSHMVVFGSTPGGTATGGRYILGHSTDDDGDGFTECQGDCNDTAIAIHPGAAEICDGLDNDCNATSDDVALPSGAPLLTMQAAGTDASLSWTPLVAATAYDVVRGDLALLRSSSGDFTPSTIGCAGNDVTGTSLTFPDDPGSGGHWYLVRAVNCRGVGSYDSGASSQSGSRDAEIAASASPCP